MNLKAIFRTTALSAALGGLLLAQGPMGQGRGFGRQQQMGPGAGLRARAGGMGALMAGYLGLTDAQKEQIQAIHRDARARMQPLQQQLRQNRQDLRAAIRAGQPVEALATAQGNLLGQMAAIRAATQQQVHNLLTPEQLAKLDQFQAKRGQRRAGPKSARPAER